MLLWLLAASLGEPSLHISPRAIDAARGAELTWSSSTHLPSEPLTCVFEHNLTQPCALLLDGADAVEMEASSGENSTEYASGDGDPGSEDGSGAAEPAMRALSTRCRCAAPTSAGRLIGDTAVQLISEAGTLGNATMTYYDSGEAPELLRASPFAVDCSPIAPVGGGPVVLVYGRNLAPTAGLRCDFGALGSAPASFIGAQRGALNASEATARCVIPPTSLIGDLPLRITHDGGVRWSSLAASAAESSAASSAAASAAGELGGPRTTLRCYDAQRPPLPLSVVPRSVDLSATDAHVAVRARNLPGGGLRCAFGAAGSGGSIVPLRAEYVTNGSVGAVSLAEPSVSVGVATCPLPSALPTLVGTLPLLLSSGDGRWSDAGACAVATHGT